MKGVKNSLINATVALFHQKEEEETDNVYHILCLRKTPPKRRGSQFQEVWGWALRRWGQKWIELEYQVRNKQFPPLTTQKKKPDTKWRFILDLPNKRENHPCVVVWQDSEHPSDEGVEVASIEKIAEGHYNRARVVDAYWTSLANAFDLTTTEWTTIKEIPPRPIDADEDADWEERGIVASKKGKSMHFVETNMFQVRDGDFRPTDRWMSVMDAPAMKNLAIGRISDIET